jgi:hypothetical protein
MKEVAGQLQKEDTGPYTRHLESEIVAGLRRLIDALMEKEREPQDKPPATQPDGTPGPHRPPPLVPPVAELRLLRQLESDIHGKTRDIHRSVQASGGKPNLIQKKMINRLAHRQAKLTEMTRKLRESLNR